MNKFIFELVLLVFLFGGILWIPDNKLRAVFAFVMFAIILHWVIAFSISAWTGLMKGVRHE